MYTEAVHKLVMNWSLVSARQLHEVLRSMRSVRTGLANGERVPEYLRISIFHAHVALSHLVKKHHEMVQGLQPELLVRSPSLPLSSAVLLVP